MKHVYNTLQYIAINVMKCLNRYKAVVISTLTQQGKHSEEENILNGRTVHLDLFQKLGAYDEVFPA